LQWHKGPLQQDGIAVMLQTCTWEMPYLNLSSVTRYPNFLMVFLSLMLKHFLKIGCFLFPNPYLVTTYHLT
jgi:hypothetical protein